jgi:hypothetical protein
VGHNSYLLFIFLFKQEIDDEWEQIKAAIVDAARDLIQTQGKSPRNEWWDEECKEIIQEKNEAR